MQTVILPRNTTTTALSAQSNCVPHRTGTKQSDGVAPSMTSRAALAKSDSVSGWGEGGMRIVTSRLVTSYSPTSLYTSPSIIPHPSSRGSKAPGLPLTSLHRPLSLVSYPPSTIHHLTRRHVAEHQSATHIASLYHYNPLSITYPSPVVTWLSTRSAALGPPTAPCHVAWMDVWAITWGG